MTRNIYQTLSSPNVYFSTKMIIIVNRFTTDYTTCKIKVLCKTKETTCKVIHVNYIFYLLVLKNKCIFNIIHQHFHVLCKNDIIVKHCLLLPYNNMSYLLCLSEN